MTIKVKKVCLKCNTFDKSQNASYKCAVKGSCPGLSWSGKKKLSYITSTTKSLPIQPKESFKRLNSAITEQYELEVIQCTCGFHLGLDASYLTQVGNFSIQCPSCKRRIRTSKVFTT